MDLLKVKILKTVGPYVPGQVVELPKDVAVQVADGKKAMLLQDFEVYEAVRKDVSNLTVKELNDMNMKNVVPNEAQEIFAKTEQAAMNGKPVASGEPLVPTGGVTPPTQVYPAMAEAGGHETTSPDDVKPTKSDKAQAKADVKKDAKK